MGADVKVLVGKLLQYVSLRDGRKFEVSKENGIVPISTPTNAQVGIYYDCSDHNSEWKCEASQMQKTANDAAKLVDRLPVVPCNWLTDSEIELLSGFDEARGEAQSMTLVQVTRNNTGRHPNISQMILKRFINLDSYQSVLNKRKEKAVEEVEKATKVCGHPNIISLFGARVNDTEGLIAMEYNIPSYGGPEYPHITDRKYRQDHGFSKPMIFSSLCTCIGRALHHMHSLRLEHTDLKLRNTVFKEVTKGVIAFKLIDFGRGISDDCDAFVRMIADVLTWDVPGFDDASFHMSFVRQNIFDKSDRDKSRQQITQKLPADLEWFKNEKLDFKAIGNLRMQDLWMYVANSRFEQGTMTAFTKHSDDVNLSTLRFNGIDLFFTFDGVY